MASLQARLASLITAVKGETKAHRTMISGTDTGDVTGLNTTATDLVGAINEIEGNGGAVSVSEPDANNIITIGYAGAQPDSTFTVPQSTGGGAPKMTVYSPSSVVKTAINNATYPVDDTFTYVRQFASSVVHVHVSLVVEARGTHNTATAKSTLSGLGFYVVDGDLEWCTDAYEEQQTGGSGYDRNRPHNVKWYEANGGFASSADVVIGVGSRLEIATNVTSPQILIQAESRVTVFEYAA